MNLLSDRTARIFLLQRYTEQCVNLYAVLTICRKDDTMNVFLLQFPVFHVLSKETKFIL